MKIPKKIKFGAHTIPVLRVGGANKKGFEFGECQYDKLQIKIATDTPRTHQEETLIHELMHAIREANGLSLSDDRQEEIVVATMAHELYNVLKINNIL